MILDPLFLDDWVINTEAHPGPAQCKRNDRLLGSLNRSSCVTSLFIMAIKILCSFNGKQQDKVDWFRSRKI